ncbi:hypothetical protein [Streptomyces olivochromogenes]|uniref:hypothetical protein n=1 Tax=Streptomyces olivochromogenes TaxID=1963 RepID=UPI000AF8E09B|nr:hypothetical protein [Streptomyces olivochromogenes]
MDAEIVGYTGPAARPRALDVRLPGGRIALTQTLKAPLAAQVSAHLVASGPSRSARTRGGPTAPRGRARQSRSSPERPGTPW